jgi:excisionase family DNA binding protein
VTIQLLSMQAVAERLSCSRTHVYDLIAAGHLRPVEISANGKRPKTRVREDDLEQYIEKQTRSVPPRTQ